MIETYLEHYVIGGGWAMLVLLPASMLAVTLIVRGWLLLNRSHIAGTAAAEGAGTGPDTTPRGLGADTATGRVIVRLRELHARTGEVSPDDVRAEISSETVALYSQFHLLVALYVLAPLVGLLGSLTAIMSANLDVVAGGGAERLAAAVERALVPTLWGVGVACVAYAGFAVLRARLFLVERRTLLPLVEAEAAALTRDAFHRSRQHAPDTRNPER